MAGGRSLPHRRRARGVRAGRAGGVAGSVAAAAARPARVPDQLVRLRVRAPGAGRAAAGRAPGLRRLRPVGQAGHALRHPPVGRHDRGRRRPARARARRPAHPRHGRQRRRRAARPRPRRPARRSRSAAASSATARSTSTWPSSRPGQQLLLSLPDEAIEISNEERYAESLAATCAPEPPPVRRGARRPVAAARPQRRRPPAGPHDPLPRGPHGRGGRGTRAPSRRTRRRSASCGASSTRSPSTP